MADQKVILTLEIQGAERQVKNIKDLKGALKDAKSELLHFDAGTAGFAKAQKNVSELQDRLDGLGDSTRISGTGVERLGASFNLLGEALTTGDVDKAKVGFTGLGQAMAAIPIFLLVEGLQLLIQNFDKVIEFVQSFTQANQGLKQSLEDVNAALQIQDQITKGLIQNVDNLTKIQLEQAKQRGASEKELNEILINANAEKLTRLKAAEVQYRKEAEEFERGFYKRTEAMSEEDQEKEMQKLQNIQKAHKETIDQIQKIQFDNVLFLETVKTKAYEDEMARLKALADARDEEEVRKYEQAEKDRQQNEADGIKRQADFIKARDAKWKAEDDERIRAEKAQADKNAKAYAAEQAYLTSSAAQRRAYADELEREEKERTSRIAATKLKIESAAFSAARDISEVLFLNQTSKLKKGADAERALKKKQFELNKGISIAGVFTDGVRSVQGALAQVGTLGPFAVGLAIANGAAAIANIAKIKNTTFDDGGGGGASGFDTGPSIQAPTIQTTQNTPRTNSIDSTKLNDNGVVTAVVVETQMSESQKRVNRLRNQATFG